MKEVRSSSIFTNAHVQTALFRHELTYAINIAERAITGRTLRCCDQKIMRLASYQQVSQLPVQVEGGATREAEMRACHDY